ncbi:MAG: OmpA family protein [Myxococcota bacterium]|nr:OmpA family protein [Myxococcota bacterium]
MTNLTRPALILACLAGCLPPAAPRPWYAELPPPRVEITPTNLVLNQAIFFEFDKDRILPVSFPILDEVARTMKEHPEIARVRIEGHTDNIGTPAYNFALSQRRAQAVRQYLLRRGVPESRLVAVGFGAQQPVADNDSEEGRAQNRRVTFIIERRLPVRQAQR